MCHSVLTVPKVPLCCQRVERTSSFGSFVALLLLLHRRACIEILLTVMGYNGSVAMCHSQGPQCHAREGLCPCGGRPEA